jgi:hypothetical protein
MPAGGGTGAAAQWRDLNHLLLRHGQQCPLGDREIIAHGHRDVDEQRA